jgi:hypothetical protein
VTASRGYALAVPRPTLSLALVLSLALAACGPPSWPEVAYPSDADTVRFATLPGDPIEGEEIALVLPMQSDGTCHAFDGPLTRGEPVDATIPLTLDGESPGTCPVVAASGAGSQLALGTLAAGRYEVRIGALTLPFEVRPASTSPGAPPLRWQIAYAIATRNQAPSGCGETYGGPSSERPWRLRDARLHHQVSAAHPEWTGAQVDSVLCAAQAVQLAPVNEHEWRYRHSASSLCHVADAIGTVHVHDDGTFEIDAPYIVDHGNVPC